MYVKPEIHTADMRKVIMNHFFQKPLLQSGVVRNSRVMMGRDKTQRIRFRSLSGMANTLLCSDGKQEERLVLPFLHQKYWRSCHHKGVLLPSGISLRPCRLRDR